jgi:hypothetical protein
MTMIERCARAIWDALESAHVPEARESWDAATGFSNDLRKDLFRQIARAAIEAMQGPLTPEMVSAGAERSSFDIPIFKRLNAVAIYKDMITAALQEPTP